MVPHNTKNRVSWRTKCSAFFYYVQQPPVELHFQRSKSSFKLASFSLYIRSDCFLKWLNISSRYVLVLLICLVSALDPSRRRILSRSIRLPFSTLTFFWSLACRINRVLNSLLILGDDSFRQFFVCKHASNTVSEENHKLDFFLTYHIEKT